MRRGFEEEMISFGFDIRVVLVRLQGWSVMLGWTLLILQTHGQTVKTQLQRRGLYITANGY